MTLLDSIDVRRLEVLLCDADGNLFPSEELAFIPSTALVNRILAEAGSEDRFEPTALRLATTGKNFRTTMGAIAAERDIELGDGDLERWVDRERRDVTTYLAAHLRPDRAVLGALGSLACRYRLAAVSSSASARLDACFEATGLARLFPASARFSAEDSLPVASSKPDPAIYTHACDRLRIEPESALAIEDSVPGVLSAVRAGVPVVGNLAFVGPAERAARESELRAAGAVDVLGSWSQLEYALTAARRREGRATTRAVV